MMALLTPAEIEIQRESALLVGKTLAEIAAILKPGIKTIDLDKLAEEFIHDNGGRPSFKGYGEKNNQFPFSLCISINNVIVHGFPSEYELLEGDVVSIDCGVEKNGLHGDHAYTFLMQGANEAVQQLVRVTKESLYKGIEQAVVGNRVGDIGYAIEQHTFGKYGYGVLRELVGHGVGRNLHEDPQIPNYGKRGSGKKLLENMVLAIEPMINMGKRNIYMDKDGWTIATKDGLPSAHFEHNVWVKNYKADILSDYTPIENAIKKNEHLIDI